jgi:hypothetical protein
MITHIMQFDRSTPSGEIYVCPICGRRKLLTIDARLVTLAEGDPLVAHSGGNIGLTAEVVDSRLEPFEKWMVEHGA